VIAENLAEVTVRYGNRGTIRRIGALLEREGIEERPLRRLEQALNGSDSVIAWVPNRPRRGTTATRWGVIVNG
jgi:predicted transcriptional regulator of viral defense system